MAVIDSDAHVIETDRTWEFMDESSSSSSPRSSSTPRTRRAPSG